MPSSSTRSNMKCDSIALNVTTVTSSPYTVLSTNCFILVDTSTIAITINLPIINALNKGKIYYIIDATGDAGTNTITITPATDLAQEKINGSTASKTITTSRGTLTMINDGVSDWHII